MKKSLKIGFPIACVVVVGGTLIALSSMKSRVEHMNKPVNEVNNTSYSNVSTSGKQSMDGIDSSDNYVTNTTYYLGNNVSNNSNTNNTNTNTNANTNINTNTNKKNNTTNTNTSKTNTKTEESSVSLDKTTDKDKAVALVKEEWGNDSSVYFTNEGESSGEYIVAVRDKNNSAAKMFFKVDVKNKKVEEDYSR